MAPLRHQCAWRERGTLFKCLIVLALEHQLGTLQTEINNQHKSSLVKCWRGETGAPGENLSVQPTNSTQISRIWLNAHMMEVEPGPHWWEAIALTTAPCLPSLHPSDYGARWWRTKITWLKLRDFASYVIILSFNTLSDRMGNILKDSMWKRLLARGKR